MKKAAQWDLGDAVIGVLTGVIAACFTGLLIGEMGGAIGAAVAFVASQERRRRRAQMQQRIDSPADLEWAVVINNVKVGAMSDATYAGLEKAVLEDWQIFWLQVKNLARVGIRAGEMLVIAIPGTIFWAGLGMVLLDPDTASSIVTAMRTAPAEQLVASAAQYANAGILCCLVGLCVLAMLASQRLGYENIYQSKLAEAVRCHVKSPADGRMMLVPGPAPLSLKAADA